MDWEGPTFFISCTFVAHHTHAKQCSQQRLRCNHSCKQHAASKEVFSVLVFRSIMAAMYQAANRRLLSDMGISGADLEQIPIGSISLRENGWLQCELCNREFSAKSHLEGKRHEKSCMTTRLNAWLEAKCLCPWLLMMQLMLVFQPQQQLMFHLHGWQLVQLQMLILHLQRLLHPHFELRKLLWSWLIKPLKQLQTWLLLAYNSQNHVPRLPHRQRPQEFAIAFLQL